MATGFAIIAPLARMLGRPLIEHLRYRFERCAPHCLTRCHLTEHDRLKCRFRVKLGCLSDEKIDRLAFGSGQNRSPSRAGQRRICRCLLLGCCVDSENRRYAEEGDIRSLFEQVLSLPQRHVRLTLRSRKLTYLAPDRISTAGGLRRPRCPYWRYA
jgi:hypothetical protein